MPINDGPTGTSSAAAIGSPHLPPPGADRRRPLGTLAGRRPGDTVRPGPPGVAHPGGNGRPNPDDLPAFRPLFSASRTGKSTVGRPAGHPDHCRRLPPILTRRHRPPDDVRGGVGAPSAGPMSSAPTSMAPKWGREEVIPVRPTRSQGARIGRKAAFALVGSQSTTRERILTRPAVIGPPHASPPTRRGKSAAGTDTKGETAADHQRPNPKGASMSTNHRHRTLPAPPRTASIQTLARRRPRRRPALPGQRTPRALPPHFTPPAVTWPDPPGAPCPQRHPGPPQTTSKNEIPHTPQTRGVRGVAPPGRHCAGPSQAPTGGAT